MFIVVSLLMLSVSLWSEVITSSKNPLNLNKTKRLTYRLFQEFVDDILDNIHEENFGTFQRMKGMLAVISEFFNFRRILLSISRISPSLFWEVASDSSQSVLTLGGSQSVTKYHMGVGKNVTWQFLLVISLEKDNKSLCMSVWKKCHVLFEWPLNLNL